MTRTKLASLPLALQNSQLVIIKDFHLNLEAAQILKSHFQSHSEKGQCILLSAHNLSETRSHMAQLLGNTAFLEWRTPVFVDQSDQVHNITEKSYILTGGHPTLLFNSDNSPASYYSSKLQLLIQQEIPSLMTLRNPDKFLIFLKALAQEAGEILSFSKLARISGVSSHTTKKWCQILQALGWIYLLRAYYQSDPEKLVKAPRLVVMDSGLVCHLLELQNEQELQKYPFWNQIWNNHLYSQWIRLDLRKGLTPRFYHWKPLQGTAVSLLWKPSTDSFSAIHFDPSIANWKTKPLDTFRNWYGRKAVSQSYVTAPIEEKTPIPGSNYFAKPAIELPNF